MYACMHAVWAGAVSCEGPGAQESHQGQGRGPGKEDNRAFLDEHIHTQYHKHTDTVWGSRREVG